MHVLQGLFSYTLIDIQVEVITSNLKKFYTSSNTVGVGAAALTISPTMITTIAAAPTTINTTSTSTTIIIAFNRLGQLNPIIVIALLIILF